MNVYYNDNEPFCCDWLANLMAAGEIPQGVIDGRSIKDVKPEDLEGFGQCHFFAGIGGWPYALRLAGWPADAPVWTGSCPCQPYSDAGKKLGDEDPRNLWPDFYRLIRECRPPIVFGEQVASRAGLGWLDGVFADLEDADYACGAADLPAACVGEKISSGTISTVCDCCGQAWIECNCKTPILVTLREDVVIGPPHIRQRLFWVANANQQRESGGRIQGPGEGACESSRQSQQRSQGLCSVSRLGKPDCTGSQSGLPATAEPRYRDSIVAAGSWTKFDYVTCRDGKQRRIESGVFPLAYRLPRSVGPSSTKQQRMELLAAKANQVGRLRGYGNAIVPQVAAEFIRAYIDITSPPKKA